MTSTLLSRPDALVAHWRTSADDDNPAGPLFSDGYAEFDLTTSPNVMTNCSLCTASRNIQCCA
jgi:hypothetical protein